MRHTCFNRSALPFFEYKNYILNFAIKSAAELKFAKNFMMRLDKIAPEFVVFKRDIKKF
jgi:hypothetical protein